ncbi:MAG: Smr/MutS family protein [Acidobacteriota bacterium]|nr:Smr/MutS family protein [Acidobacteriota bacterium]
MPFQVGEPVVVRGLGTGVVREVRRGGRYLVAIGAATMVCAEDRLKAPKSVRKGGRAGSGLPVQTATPGAAATSTPTLDLHGLTVEEALQRVDERLNQALLDGAGRLDIVHGKGRGLIRAALQRHLQQIPSVRRFEIDARNPGVTHLYL